MLAMRGRLPCPEIVAHRGASRYAPEHTHEAYRLALTQGADVLELDVRCAADGQLLVVHDPTLLRTAGERRRVNRLTRADLEGLAPEARPLTLDAVLERYGRAARLLVELKEPDAGWEGLVVDAVERHDLAPRVVLQSFDLGALRRLRLRAPHLRLCALHARRPSSRTLDAVARCASGVGVWHHRVDAALVAAARARGLTVHAWTVNSPAALDRMVGCAVDGLITDVPDVAVAAARAAAAAAQAA